MDSYYYNGKPSAYNEVNRLPNLDAIEWKLISHLLKSQTKHANNIWKILKYDTDINALNNEDVSIDDRMALVSQNNGNQTSKRVFLQPFVDEAWSEQCSSIYFYVNEVVPFTVQTAKVNVVIECIVHSKISVINGDGDPILNPDANPNDSNMEGPEGHVVVTTKNRANVLLKSLIAEFNGLYIDGVGYLLLTTEAGKGDKACGAKMNLWNSRSFYGYTITFTTQMSGVSDDPARSF